MTRRSGESALALAPLGGGHEPSPRGCPRHVSVPAGSSPVTGQHEPFGFVVPLATLRQTRFRGTPRSGPSDFWYA